MIRREEERAINQIWYINSSKRKAELVLESTGEDALRRLKMGHS